ncbi:putative polyketide synthase [Aspergillus karnatakaensis]|uniref:type I polyketide synthase n=1 Tax=Aspergillus karnatakaensis TaxID=1810916 RepID=UPI003CCDD1A0
MALHHQPTCHLPGGIRSPSDLWAFLDAKKSARSRIPASRFNIDGFYHPDNTKPGTTNIDHGYFLDSDIQEFDNAFFGINNLEASHMDPQQRKLLEVVYECFEDAGVSMASVAGSRTGVFVGSFTIDYQNMQARDPEYLSRFSMAGGGLVLLANRVGHVFDLKGPSMTIDTGCSASMYALHHAITAIRNGDCDSAIAAANLIISPEWHLKIAKAFALSPTGECHTFDAAADGYARAEGVTAIYIKRVVSAMKDENRIQAVIRRTAVNANGKTPGIALPSTAMQETVIRQAYRTAGLDFQDTDYVECHGTGTVVGDPIEIDAIARCFAPRHNEALRIGAVKPNLGHGEAASGLTSVLKVVLAFENGMIPPTYGVTTPNPKLKLHSRNFKVRASINSFGYGGANGHAILESFQNYLSDFRLSPKGELAFKNEIADRQTFVLPFSAASSKALQTRCQHVTNMVVHLGTRGALETLACSMGKCEPGLQLRDFLLATPIPKPTLLDPIESGDTAQFSRVTQSRPFAFMFSGQGSQYPGMARELMEQSPTFRLRIRELDRILQSLPAPHRPEWTLEDSISDPITATKVHEVTRSQPLCTAIQIAVIDILHSWSVVPFAVIGHSSGEIAAFYAAGLLSAREAFLVAYFRGLATSTLQPTGAMLAAGISAESAEGLIQELGLKQVQVACFNAPGSVTFSGSKGDIHGLQTELQKRGWFSRKLETSGLAYHSFMIREAGDIYMKLVQPYLKSRYRDKSSTVTVFSTAGRNPEDMVMIDHATDLPVQFSSALARLMDKKDFHLLDIGPHCTLKGMVKQIYEASNRHKPRQDSTPLYSPTLSLAGMLFLHGHELNWLAVNNTSTIQSCSAHKLPPYPWDYSNKLLWHEPRASIDSRNRKYPRHELLGTQNPAGNGIDLTWRNIIRHSEVPWLRDHKLEQQAVLPGSAYVAIAVKALLQICNLKGKNINFIAPLIVCDDTDLDSGKTELHTIMSQRKISTATLQLIGHTKLHCSGSIRVLCGSTSVQGSVTISGEGYECNSGQRWYDAIKQEGLNFGPHFQSITSLHTDPTRISTDAITTTNLRPPLLDPAREFYPLHPITLDACFQGAMFGSTGADMSQLQAFIPNFISECKIQVPLDHSGFAPIGKSGNQSEECKIHSRMQKTGFATCRVDCTLRGLDGTPLVDISGLQMTLYTIKNPGLPELETANNPFVQRQPCLRVCWKPDISRVEPGSEIALNQYIDTLDLASQRMSDTNGGLDASTRVIAGVLDLVGHRLPRMRVLEVTGEGNALYERFSSLLGMGTAFPRCQSWDAAHLVENDKLVMERTGDSRSFDVVVVAEESTFHTTWNQASEQLMSLVDAGGIVITRRCNQAVASLVSAGITTLRLDNDILLAIPPINITPPVVEDVLIVKPRILSAKIEYLASAVVYHLLHTGIQPARAICLDDLDTMELPSHMSCICLLEIEHGLLTTINPTDMDRVRKLTDASSNLVWLTGANMLGSPRPDLTLCSGLSRTLMVEQPTLRFIVLDIGNTDLSLAEERDYTCRNIAGLLNISSLSSPTMNDREFIQSDSLLYISRFVPDFALNLLFRGHRHLEPPRLSFLADSALCRLAISQPGMTDTIHFEQIWNLSKDPPVGYVDVALKAVALNAKDVYSLNGRVETRDAPTVGADPNLDLQLGDRVVALMPNHFSTVERIPAYAVHKMLPQEEHTVLPTLLTVYCTALYALRDRAHLRAGETVLIHSAAGAVGFAAIIVARRLNATIYATEMGVPETHIFNSRDTSFVDGIMTATKGWGVDIILNSLVGDLLHASWACLAQFGRFVEIGKRELVDAGRLDMGVFLRGATFSTFDLAKFMDAANELYRDVVRGLVAEVLTLYRAGEITPPPLKVFDVSEISKAYRYFNTRDRIGKVVVSTEDPQSLIPLSLAPYRSFFSPTKSYLLIGCLGGLGRSLTRWMLSRGARKFVFLGRSGCDKPSAAELVSSLKDIPGTTVEVVRGNVANLEHVRRAVAACIKAGPLGGVVQGTMALAAVLFKDMTSEDWLTAIEPKWRGTWNLHRILEENEHEADLDFFLLLSSISGSYSAMKESNYCAANSFLDAFAKWRRANGKTAVSLGLGMVSEVGYLHENPEIEASEFLSIVDLALSDYGSLEDRGINERKRNDQPQAHILTGLETCALRELVVKQGYEITNGFMEDPRTSLLAASLLAEAAPVSTSDPKQADHTGHSESAPPWLPESNTLPANTISLLNTERDAPTLHDAILCLIKKRFSSLILMPVEQVDETRPISTYGVDSLTAAEMRGWVWRLFGVDVPFLDLVGAGTNGTLMGLCETVEGGLLGR